MRKISNNFTAFYDSCIEKIILPKNTFCDKKIAFNIKRNGHSFILLLCGFLISLVKLIRNTCIKGFRIKKRSISFSLYSKHSRYLIGYLQKIFIINFFRKMIMFVVKYALAFLTILNFSKVVLLHPMVADEIETDSDTYTSYTMENSNKPQQNKGKNLISLCFAIPIRDIFLKLPLNTISISWPSFSNFQEYRIFYNP